MWGDQYQSDFTATRVNRKLKEQVSSSRLSEGEHIRSAKTNTVKTIKIYSWKSSESSGINSFSDSIVNPWPFPCKINFRAFRWVAKKSVFLG